ncbi:outer membrane receptor protein involved in Fe transport [Pseudobacter ginsenosidimutans]|uniref:Outer membrane receptor protein involved in Fe transport n=1 Tax=Pseudobacter ginsenosidimutans TaxID=661488 RepID=A0A4Q7N2P4_9BACT|nr:outer membrane receptor protein involved in Fe transport [Pseudobacter ginsenosidimutans]
MLQSSFCLTAIPAFSQDQDSTKAKALEKVTVVGRSATQLVNRQAYNVTAIDAKKLYNSTLDLAHALDRVSGVRVRETGGVGSSINFAINGFSGNQVRFFLDGIPMDNFGSSFQLNNIPINFAERVEVYKGVVPIWLGSDALGGAVNIVTGSKHRNYVDVSYSYGSFNTHRSAINAAFTSQKGFTVQVNAFQNYSDNNYKVTLDVSDIHTGKYSPNTTVRRFHDTYHNETLITNIGFVDKPWADKLLLGISLGKNYREMQTGARMVSVFGAWHRRGNMVMPTLKYQKKNLFVKGLDLTFNANYNLGKEQNIDTAFRRYDWYGNYKQYEGQGSERSRTMYKYGNNTGLATATFNYRINDHQSVSLNNVFTTFSREGSDELYPDEKRYEIPQKSIKNILGLGYKYEVTDKWSATVFGKYLMQEAKTDISYNPTGNWGDVAYRKLRNTVNNFGYGVAGSYFIHPELQLKFSYEKSNRLPENEEMFGDEVNQQSNFSLRPEISDNLNLGASYGFNIKKDHRFLVSGSAIYRFARDFIYFLYNANQAKLTTDNLDGVSNIGGEAELRYSYKSFITGGVNLTYQHIVNLQKLDPKTGAPSVVYKDVMPNLPYLYGNADASIFFRNLVGKDDQLSFGYNLLYVNTFWLYWPSQGGRTATDEKRQVPRQISHDVNIVYAMKSGRYNIALECRNINDAQLYDNFSLQKPSRSFNIKFRYFYAK